MQGDGGDRPRAKTPLKETNTADASASTPWPVKQRSAAASDSKCYARRRKALRKNEERVRMPSTCPSKRRRNSSSSVENEKALEQEDERAVESKAKKRRRRQPVKHKARPKPLKLPHNFVRDQQQYFAEVDAFELQEESSSPSHQEHDSGSEETESRRQPGATSEDERSVGQERGSDESESHRSEPESKSESSGSED